MKKTLQTASKQIPINLLQEYIRKRSLASDYRSATYSNEADRATAENPSGDIKQEYGA
jgi:hypothetical protein